MVTPLLYNRCSRYCRPLFKGVNRLLSTQEHALITTPIFYVNAKPHIGHVYSAVLADSLARYQKLSGTAQVHLSTGTDEHGNKVLDAARKANLDPVNFCDSVSSAFEKTFKDINVEANDFVRTTSAKHRNAVEHIWNTLIDNNYIYLGYHEGWYCRSDECFLAPNQVVDGPNGPVTRDSGASVEWLSEPNYKFKLSLFANRLRTWLQQDPCPIYPVKYKTELLQFLDQGLQDLSVSRLSSRAAWGIPVPNDPTHNIYVWLDALTNYLTTSGYPDQTHMWPPTTQVIGKDIIRFHAIYWPAFLMAAGLQLPSNITVHAHWTVNGGKMSKSVGNVVCPTFLASTLGGPDPLRFFLLSHSSIDYDANFSLDDALVCVNHFLADQFGNLYSRAIGLLRRELNQNRLNEILNNVDPSHVCFTELESLAGRVQSNFAKAKFSVGLKEISDFVALVNQWFTSRSPWQATATNSEETIVVAINCCRIVAILLQPVIPTMSSSILSHMRIPEGARAFNNCTMKWQGLDLLPNQKKFVFFQRRELSPANNVLQQQG
uniref:methionine--tRNA ligase n=1 Tax=Spongospora subterranea TaxID=70186 RepID=A0A0H5QZE3_9EUKA|eukprot:CRZ00934.1 hypothetical protein [Spongospora subterranea]